MIGLVTLIVSCLTFIGIAILGIVVSRHMNSDTEFQNDIVTDFAVIEELRKRVDGHDDLFENVSDALNRIEIGLKQVQDKAFDKL